MQYIATASIMRTAFIDLTDLMGRSAIMVIKNVYRMDASVQTLKEKQKMYKWAGNFVSQIHESTDQLVV